MHSDLVDIAGILQHETEKAYLLFDGSKKVWVPKSHVDYDPAERVFTMPEWLALEKGLI
jgi:hypothetical protein